MGCSPTSPPSLPPSLSPHPVPMAMIDSSVKLTRSLEIHVGERTLAAHMSTQVLVEWCLLPLQTLILPPLALTSNGHPSTLARHISVTTTHYISNTGYMFGQGEGYQKISSTSTLAIPAQQSGPESSTLSEIFPPKALHA